MWTIIPITLCLMSDGLDRLADVSGERKKRRIYQHAIAQAPLSAMGLSIDASAETGLAFRRAFFGRNAITTGRSRFGSNALRYCLSADRDPTNRILRQFGGRSSSRIRPGNRRRTLDFLYRGTDTFCSRGMARSNRRRQR